MHMRGDPIVCVLEARPGAGQDRARATRTTDGLLAVLADGAGGTSYGGEAAACVVDEVSRVHVASAAECVALLARLDGRLSGQTTAIVLCVLHGLVFGASVGDSEAVMKRGDGMVDLTAGQKRKPLLGSGRATVAAIGPMPLTGRLLLGSDGLFKYVQYAHMATILALPLERVAPELVDAARLPSGALQDDLSLVLADVTEG